MAEGGKAKDRASGRTHVVLVPGFVGFDALGNLEYYAGVTAIFQDWKEVSGRQRAVIHYFDNFPTASVELRSQRLGRWLAKRVARGEFGPDDRVALVGHSTGGLDIRRTVRTMAREPGAQHALDGSCYVSNQTILERIARITFLSVPHYGTNLADFGFTLSSAAKGVLKNAAIGIRLNRGLLARARRTATSRCPTARSDVRLAFADPHDESDQNAMGSASQQASEREARAQFALWIEHMGDDFSIIGDLRSSRGTLEGAGSPAHDSSDERSSEMKMWKSFGISTQSYATYVPRTNGRRGQFLDSALPALKVLGEAVDQLAAPINRGAELWSLPLLALPSLSVRIGLPVLSLPAVVGVLNGDPKLLFDFFQAVCADRSGNFQNPNERKPNSIAPEMTWLASGKTVKTSSLSVSDSDGVVNTLSMCWPYDPADPKAHPIRLLTADHGDIIGHFTLKPVAIPTPKGRKYRAYDFFQSESGFGDAEFRMVWKDVFDFCTRP